MQMGYRAKVVQALADVDLMAKKLVNAKKTPALEAFLGKPSRKRLAKYFMEAYMDRLGNAVALPAAEAASADLSGLVEEPEDAAEVAPPRRKRPRKA